MAAKTVQVHAERHPNWAYVKNDGTNAYCEMPRAQALQDVAAAFPALGRCSAVWYARESKYLVHRPDGTSEVIRSNSGWEQGDPLSPAGYSIGSLRALRAARARIQDLVGQDDAGAVLLFAYLDDVVLGVPGQHCAAALQILREELAAIRHFPAPHKTEIWSPGGHRPPGLLAADDVAWRPEGLTVLGLPLPPPGPQAGAAPAPPAADAQLRHAWEDAAAALAPGAVVGSEAFVAAFVRARVSAAERLAQQALRTVDEGEAGDPTAQSVGLILRLCVLPRLLHLFRGHYARSLTNLASEFDAMMRVVAARLWRTTPNWSATVEMQVQLPLRRGGMGLRPMREVAPAAYLGSRALGLPTVQSLVGGAPILGPGAPPSASATAVAQAEADWQQLSGRPRDEPVDWPTVAASAGLPRQQRALSQALDRARGRRLEAAADPADWVRIQACAGSWASVWLTVTPTEHDLSFLDAEYAVLVRFRLRLPLRPEGGPCAQVRRAAPPDTPAPRRGGTWYDAEGDHAHSCPRNSGPRTRRHNRLRNAIRTQLQWLGFTAHTEQEVPGLQHRPDVRASGFSIPTTHFEVHVTHPNRLASDPELRRRGQSPSAFVEGAWRWRLEHDYQGGPPPRAAYDLVPAVASSYGGWHPSFAQWWRGAVRMAAEHAGSLASQTGMLWRTVGILSVTLQRQTFQVLAACVPAMMHEVEGRLGRPLSEDPEFWRAAPEAALHWSVEEFGFPDQRREDGHGANAEVDQGYSAAGHLRAAGMRL